VLNGTSSTPCARLSSIATPVRARCLAMRGGQGRLDEGRPAAAEGERAQARAHHGRRGVERHRPGPAEQAVGVVVGTDELGRQSQRGALLEAPHESSPVEIEGDLALAADAPALQVPQRHAVDVLERESGESVRAEPGDVGRRAGGAVDAAGQSAAWAVGLDHVLLLAVRPGRDAVAGPGRRSRVAVLGAGAG
jgi:hypothetical protein